MLNIFIVECTSANHRNLYYNVATKLLVAVVISCVSAIALTLITFPSSSGLIQYIFAQITPASLGIDTGNTSSGINASSVDQLATLTPNVFNSSSVIQLATLSSNQPITPSSYNGGGSDSNDNEDVEDDETEDTNYNENDEDSSNYDDDNNSDDNNNDNNNNNGNTIVITSTGSYDSEDDDSGNSDYAGDESDNEVYYDDTDRYYDTDEVTSGITIGSSGAFASAGGGGSGAFASVG